MGEKGIVRYLLDEEYQLWYEVEQSGISARPFR